MIKAELQKVKADLHSNRTFAQATVSSRGRNLIQWTGLSATERAEALRVARSIVSPEPKPAAAEPVAAPGGRRAAGRRQPTRTGKQAGKDKPAAREGFGLLLFADR